MAGFLQPHALAGADPYLGGDYQLAIHPRAERATLIVCFHGCLYRVDYITEI